MTIQAPNILNDFSAYGIDMTVLPDYNGPCRSINDTVDWEFFRSVEMLPFDSARSIDYAQGALEEVISRVADKEKVEFIHVVSYSINGPSSRGYDVYLRWVDVNSDEGRAYLVEGGWIE